MTDPAHKALTQERFGRFTAGYVASQTHAKGEDLERLVAIAQPRRSWRVLDVATGGGHTALKFAPHVARVIATDLTHAMLLAARQHATKAGAANLSFAAADAEALPFASGVFDLVTCRIAPHHFPDVARFVAEAARALRPGGLLLIQDHVVPEDPSAGRYAEAFEKLRDPSHNRAFSQSEWAGMLAAAGLTVEHREQIVKRHDFLPWVERQACTQEVIEQLVELARQAPPAAAEWLQLNHFNELEQASFANHHLIIAARA